MSDKKNKKQELISKNFKKSLQKEIESDDNYSEEDYDDQTTSSENDFPKKKTKILLTDDVISSDADSKDGEISDDSNDGANTDDSEDGPSKEITKQKNKIVTNDKPIKNSNEIFKELIKQQLPDVPTQWKLNINDMKRICKYINTSIFDENNCCIWNGYITNMNNSNKGTYVNFYFRNKKVALHRLLYSNFVAPLDSSEYLKFNCNNKGICCNINHYEKYKYSKNISIVKREQKQKESKKEIKEITIIGSDEPDKLIIDFD